MPSFKNGYNFIINYENEKKLFICMNCASVSCCEPTKCEFYKDFITRYSWDFIEEYLDLEKFYNIDHPNSLFYNMISVVLNKIFNTYNEFERTSKLGKKILILSIQDLLNKGYIKSGEFLVMDIDLGLDEKIIRVSNYIKFIELIVCGEIIIESSDEFIDAFNYIL